MKRRQDEYAVLFPLAVPQPYYYARPDDMAPLAAGDFVLAPLGGKPCIGVVWEMAQQDRPPTALKLLLQRLDITPLSAELRHFIDWIAAYTFSPAGMVLRMATRIPLHRPARSEQRYYVAAPVPAACRMTSQRRAILDCLADGLPRMAAKLAQETGIAASLIHAFAKAGGLHPLSAAEAASLMPLQSVTPFRRREDFSVAALLEATPRFNAEQRQILDSLIAMIEADRFDVGVLDGVTGSGKTEIYLEAVAELLANGRQGLVLLPEIALTARFLERFETCFGLCPASWHSALTPPRRAEIWHGVAERKHNIVIGTRSALFLPFADLGLIVVDEEHDATFKQQDGVLYQARDMAVVRASLAAIPIVLVSATPSLETEYNIRRKRYRRFTLTRRWAQAALPQLVPINLRDHPPPSGSWLSPPLVAAMRETLAQGQQVLLYLNRRGYAPLTLCRFCGTRIMCTDCDMWMVEHRHRHGTVHCLMCHHCGLTRPYPTNCEHCHEADALIACGPGVERIAEEVARDFPTMRSEILSSDRKTDLNAETPTLEELIRRIETNQIDIIIGTQIIAKGYHFPDLTLVGIVDADIGLGQGDLRDSEHCFQSLHQVAGRSGREADRRGRVLVQTRMPDHPVMKAVIAQDRQAFVHGELSLRAAMKMPPFQRLAAVILAAEDEKHVQIAARVLVRHKPQIDAVIIRGPMPAAFLRRRYRIRFLLKAARHAALQQFIAHWLEAARADLRTSGVGPNKVRMIIDIDPYGFF